ncbi:MAG: hypothetical protein GTN67_00095 [Hydrotalea flava]|uniref:hypothetical protein n=1 Tax=Hydrotalea TaxID=1004300 RepID=UPI000942D378|nr:MULTISPECIES: hypothetical protein [Hydrotalea]MBY0346890.1 hypothetical protein [Hydrotalea flava]NIM33906.1 hypothetical protein [Hydrotalea flava]NIM36735.1 hypothetical protein [Hydrotalea flava]NIN01921.1 hypothetical protein [Hydrotalea flava]NIN13579.1 hypothetical protein [Hydrotalea flava]
MLEERLVINEISKEQYQKFSKKYIDAIRELSEELEQKQNMSSNLEKAIDKGLKIAKNISQMWITAKYLEKKKLQYLIFPDGMVYDKKNNTV